MDRPISRLAKVVLITKTASVIALNYNEAELAQLLADRLQEYRDYEGVIERLPHQRAG